ncbi:MBL fold metallo-hydrolase [Desulfosporosinus lacus]|uniref:L-ascorbate metabolism protein UlaG, beta-lactamase superfamily n=1 Tax=Desulfosporosinus lacus DSM 15449 TaxID=1121420 RepID=A0A1M6DP97_9FIRM|nr:MBL fold metallo-hydrolase [Desulfosporosinus lacus]SHI74973.1 L-ascorbate metabolism protein UlaG, beta-lactamase superfamily [Desulfosporosinus lacus DSM 15449]
MKKLIKIVLYFFGFLALLVVGITLFINLYPSFGGNPSKAEKEIYSQFDNYVNGKFVNEVPTVLSMSSSESVSANKDAVAETTDRNPTGEIPVSVIDWNKIKSEKDSLTWFGHSAFLVSIDNKKLLIDPMLGPIASPVSFAGIKRYKYSEDMLNIIDEMPPIDAVFISHDHYDHLDYQSIVKLKSKVSHFFVPIGVSTHLIRWGVPKERITELNWWDEMEHHGLTVALTPSRHFSGRGIFNRDTTLWGGWVILGKSTRLYASGDGGYGSHFKEIGTKYGPIDMALIEGGQYDRRWADTHMTPEQSVQANLDINGKNMMLMHWGAFTLANHGWKEPIERAFEGAKKADVNLIAPQICETVLLDSDLHIPSSAWWNLNAENQVASEAIGK